MWYIFRCSDSWNNRKIFQNMLTWDMGDNEFTIDRRLSHTIQTFGLWPSAHQTTEQMLRQLRNCVNFIGFNK